jgi:hypothetical protein
MPRALAVLVASLSLGRCLSGQSLHGTARDSVTRRPVSGLVVTLLDSSGATAGRLITNERGEYHVPAIGGVRRLRAQRLGFRMREITLPAFSGDTLVDITVVQLPSLLEPVRVVANAQCPNNARAEEAYGLLQQARSGLLTEVVARETNPGTLTRLEYERHLGIRGKIETQDVRMTTAVGTRSFRAGRTGEEFVRLGFAGPDTTYGVDADVLLDDGFAAGYCFRIAGTDKARPNQVGLAFAAPRRKNGRVDLDGVLWIDTVTLALRDLEFSYVSPQMRSPRPTGRTTFLEIPNGVVLIESWYARLSSIEGGGVLAHASWPDGTVWNAKLGGLRGEVRWRGSDTVAAGAMLRLKGTSYVTTVDSAGAFVFNDLLPGPYLLEATDAELASMALGTGSSYAFEAVGDSMKVATVHLNRVDDYIWDRCGRRRFPTKPLMLLGRVMDQDDLPVPAADVSFGHAGFNPFSEIHSDEEGVFELCLPTEQDQDPIFVRVGKEGYLGVAATYVMGYKPTTVKAVIRRR